MSGYNPRWSNSANYFEDFPNPKSTNFVGFPICVIDTEMDTNRLTIKDKKQMMYSSVITFYTDYFVEKDKNLLNSYLNAVVHWFNTNKHTLRWTYGLWGIKISKERSIDIINQSRVVLGELTFEYHVTLDTST